MIVSVCMYMLMANCAYSIMLCESCDCECVYVCVFDVPAAAYSVKLGLKS